MVPFASPFVNNNQPEHLLLQGTLHWYTIDEGMESKERVVLMVYCLLIDYFLTWCQWEFFLDATMQLKVSKEQKGRPPPHNPQLWNCCTWHSHGVQQVSLLLVEWKAPFHRPHLQPICAIVEVYFSIVRSFSFLTMVRCRRRMLVSPPILASWLCFFVGMMS
jgi:hypothetical protein